MTSHPGNRSTPMDSRCRRTSFKFLGRALGAKKRARLRREAALWIPTQVATERGLRFGHLSETSQARGLAIPGSLGQLRGRAQLVLEWPERFPAAAKLAQQLAVQDVKLGDP